MEEIPITKGIFQLSIRSSKGIKLRGQPIDPYYYQNHTRCPVLKHGETITCDQKLSSTSGVCFYRQQGTDLWIFDKRSSGDDDDDSEIVAEIISKSESSSSFLGKNTRDDNNDNNNFNNSLKHPWSPQFIRGNANAICGLQEIDFDPHKKIISYRSSDDVTINIYFETRMIGTVLLDNNKSRNIQGRIQRFHRNCSDAELIGIFQDPWAYRGGHHQCSKRARLRPSQIATTTCTLLGDEDGGWDGDFDFDFAAEREPRGGIITPDASFSSTVERDEQQDDDDNFDAEQESRRNLVDCQKEIKNIQYREGNILRAIRMHEEERMRDATIMEIKTQEFALYRIQKEEEEELQHLLGEEEERLRRIEEERRVVRERRRYRSLLENVYVGSIVGCFIGIAVSPLFGPFLVQNLGL